ncbi:MAG TPA: hypothetical protein VEF91_00290 [Verrucomicrobiae bacterium]|nr:hypothetical protein [Verrucomicrobiae bacterium]
MVASKRKHKRSNYSITMLLPAILFIFLIGWCMYCIGNQERPDKKQHKPLKEENVTIMPILYEETQEIINK